MTMWLGRKQILGVKTGSREAREAVLEIQPRNDDGPDLKGSSRIEIGR